MVVICVYCPESMLRTFEHENEMKTPASVLPNACVVDHQKLNLRILKT